MVIEGIISVVFICLSVSIGGHFRFDTTSASKTRTDRKIQVMIQ